MTDIAMSRDEYREAAVRHFQHQPRERAVACLTCQRPTLNVHARCDLHPERCDRCPPEPARSATSPGYWAEPQTCPGCGVNRIWQVGGLCPPCIGDYHATRPTPPARLWGHDNGGSVE